MRQARTAALVTALATIVACVFCLGQEATLFDGAYRVDLFSQVLKLVFAVGFLLILLLSGDLAGHPRRREARVLPLPHPQRDRA